MFTVTAEHQRLQQLGKMTRNQISIYNGKCHSTKDPIKDFTLKNKGASKGSSSDAIEEPFLVPQRTIQSKVL